MEQDRITAMIRIAHILKTIGKIEDALEDRIMHTEDPGFLASSHIVEQIRRSTVIDITALTLCESNVCTSGGCSLLKSDYNLLEDAGLKLDRLDLEIRKGATVERALQNVLSVSREEIEDAGAYL